MPNVVVHGEARVGRALKGEVRLEKARGKGSYEIWLTCDKWTDEGLDTHYSASLEAVSRQDAKGWFLPFEFEIPLSAPHSGLPAPGEALFGGLPFRWKLGVEEPGLFGNSHVYDLELEPALFAEALAAADKASLEGRGLVTALKPAWIMAGAVVFFALAIVSSIVNRVLG